ICGNRARPAPEQITRGGRNWPPRFVSCYHAAFPERPLMRLSFACRSSLVLLAALCLCRLTFAQPMGPQPWWPSQPRPLPLVHPLFTSDMVLQREIRAPIWGWSKPGEKIAIQFDGQPAGEAMTGADGRWSTKIGPYQAGGPHTLSV